MELKEKLLNIQQELKAPKGRNNRFGGYYYRSTEDILTALKPLMKKNKVTLIITDDLILIGDRYYIKATACLKDVESDSDISVSAYAREALERKKSDDSQLTGAASSYARKYALNGLFLIDDTADADTYEDNPEELDRQEAKEQEEEKPARKPRGRKKSEPEEDIADHERYFFIEKDSNVLKVPAGEAAPEGGAEINEVQYKAAFREIAKGDKGLDLKKVIEEADFMNIPEGVDEEELPFATDEDKPKTRRTRRKR